MSKLYLQRLLSRRQFFIGGISTATAIATLFLTKLQVLSYLIYPFKSEAGKLADLQSRKFVVVGKKSLQQRARSKGIIYGAFPEADDRKFAKDSEFRSKLVSECKMMPVGTYWYTHRPKPDTFDFTSSDYFVKFGTENKLLMRGHPLVWHEFLPDWVAATVTKDNAKQILTNHVETIVKRYAGKIHSWDVVNEGIDISKGRRADGIRNSLWMKFLGADYLDIAFRTAAKADPRAKLVYNDFGVEYDSAGYDEKREAILNLLQRLKSNGTPIYALGIQSHLFGDRHPFKPRKFQEFLKNVASLGLKIMITELDVEDRHLPKDIAQRDRLVAAAYEDYLAVALAQKAVVSVTTWGLSDRYTWLAGHNFRADKAEKRPLPFDRNLKPKLAWNAIARAFDRAPKR
ncbi:endo-1,4-beta-xylanase [Chamaesiphon minutus]|uniref:Beta-xylanase n=1 Tax=Chamaesiphon minutus (strain ATCC 27169 / PCC 6605) TaxID=1173020 RepID=K9UHG1_CHAP6|nr:endo-1,4-beta-xylanase [Chamaesiphon minutus]AFY93871.1 beta-1,4-xylanase [Chamaesiphon minutus PCC 6605]